MGVTTADVVVAGAGHNSLIAAAYLARAGYECLILDARPQPGGGAATEELVVPGFRFDSCSTGHTLIQSSPTLRHDELSLFAEYGLEYLEPDPVAHVAFGDGEAFTMWLDVERTCQEIARFSARDALAYRRLLADYDEIKAGYGAWRYTPIGFGPSLEEILAARPSGHRWLRRHAMSAWDVIRHQFEDPHVRRFMLWMAFQTAQPLDSAGSGLLAYSLVYGRQQQSWVLPRGGSATLPQALVRLLEAHGASFACRRRVVRLIVEGGRCRGVETDDGERYLAREAVLSSIHVRPLLDMAPPDEWGEDFRYGVETFDPGLSLFAAYYATTEPPLYPEPGGGTVTAVSTGIVGTPEQVIRIGHDARLGRVALDAPWLLVATPTVADPSRAPEGGHTVKVLGMQPYEIDGGPEAWEERKGEVAAANLAHLRRLAPNLTDEKILGSAVVSPVDIERKNPHMWHGTAHGGDRGLANSGPLRPAAGWAQHRLPIAGLYQTGATTHPGGSISGAPGRNAAVVLLHDLGTSIEEVVAGARRPRAGSHR